MAQQISPKQKIKNTKELPKARHSVQWGSHEWQCVYRKPGQMKIFIGDVTADGIFHEVGFYENQLMAVVEALFDSKFKTGLAKLRNKLRVVANGG